MGEIDRPGGPGEARPFRLGHCPALDGLRGVAILLVLGFHTVLHQPRGGFLGVDLFFVLSGFLITALLLQEQRDTGSVRLKAFYLRRALRLLPALLAVTLVCGLGALAFGGAARARATLGDALGALAYYANWRFLSGGPNNGLLRHTWSLAIEEQFYLLWPALLAGLLALRARRAWIVAVVLAGVALPLVLRTVLWRGAESWPALYFRTDTRADALFFGCLLALAISWGPAPRGRGLRLLHLAALPAVAALGWQALQPLGRAQSYLFRAGFSVIALCSAVLIGVAVRCPPWPLRRLLELRPLTGLGRISYGLYLWHIPVYDALDAALDMAPEGKAALQPLAALAVATLSYYALERPFLRLKGRLCPPGVMPTGPGPARAVSAAAACGEYYPGAKARHKPEARAKDIPFARASGL